MALVPYNIPDQWQMIEDVITTQFKDQPVIYKYLRLWVEEINELFVTFKDLATDRDIDSATGEALNIIGRIVGQERTIVGADLYNFFGFKGHIQALGFGDIYAEGVGGQWWSLGAPLGGDVTLTDEQYRSVIKARIMRNNSRGTPEDMLNYIRFVFGVNGKFTFNEGGVARIGVGRKLSNFEKALVAAEFTFQKYPTYYSPKPVGVALELFEYDSTGTLGFIGTPGAKGMISLSQTNPDGGIFATVKYFDELPPVPPAYELDLNKDGVLPGYMAFTRSSTATYFDANGKMQISPANTPRMDYDPYTRQFSGWLLEEGRTNLHASTGTNLGWVTNGLTTATSTVDAPLSPEKFMIVTQDTATSSHGLRADISGIQAGQTVTRSVFVKPKETKWVYLEFTTTGGAITQNSGCFFNLETGVMEETRGSLSGWTIKRISSDVWRISISIVTTGAGSIRTWLYQTAPNKLIAYPGDGVSQLYVWGTQLEIGSSPSSYIPAPTAAVSRASELARGTGLALPYDGFTWYIDCTKYSGADGYPIAFSDNPTAVATFVGVAHYATSIRVNSTEGWRSERIAPPPPLGSRLRAAVSVSNNMPLNMLVVNSQVAPDMILNYPAVSFSERNIMKLCAVSSAVTGIWHVRKVSVYTEVFSKDQLQYLTYSE